MDLTKLNIDEFTELLGSSAPAPGGGAAAAVAGCLGCALVEMVISLTKGKPKYSEFEPLMSELGESVVSLRARLLASINKDAEAYGLVSAAYKMENNTEEQKERRKAAIQKALKEASEAPLELMRLSYEAVCLCERAVGRSNQSVAADLATSAALLKSASHGAYINVVANLKLILDNAFNEKQITESRRLLSETEQAADRIIDSFLK